MQNWLEWKCKGWGKDKEDAELEEKLMDADAFAWLKKKKKKAFLSTTFQNLIFCSLRECDMMKRNQECEKFFQFY